MFVGCGFCSYGAVLLVDVFVVLLFVGFLLCLFFLNSFSVGGGGEVVGVGGGGGGGNYSPVANKMTPCSKASHMTDWSINIFIYAPHVLCTVASTQSA